MPSIGNRVSRWTPAIFACALASFVAAQGLIAGGLGWPVAAEAAPATLVDVHLLTVGWLTLLMFGALFQFVPVVTSRNLLTQHLSLAALVLMGLGLACMIGGFLLLGSGTATRCLPVGGGFVATGALAGIVNLIVPLISKRPLPLSAQFVLAGLVFLLLTIGPRDHLRTGADSTEPRPGARPGRGERRRIPCPRRDRRLVHPDRDRRLL